MPTPPQRSHDPDAANSHSETLNQPEALALPRTLTLDPEAPTANPAFLGEASGRVAVPGYEVLGLLGRGGMGVVYKARHLKLDRIVALKMILARGHAGAADLARFRTEAESIARLQHPNIVQVFEVSEHNGLPYFSLEFCPGGSLEKELGGTPLPPREAAALVEQLARGMEAAHRKGVIHRDLKPANVLRAEDGTPKVTDFGLAKKLDDQGHTQTGAIVGTPSYMAPEQAGGKSKELSTACDVYALGAILYECLTGRPPFRAATVMDTLMQVIDNDPVPPRQLQPQVPRDLETICLKCLEKERGKRYPSAEALGEDLRRFVIGEPIGARPTPLWERGIKWARRRPAVAGLVAAITVGTLALLVLGWWSYVSIQRAERERRTREALEAREERERTAREALEARERERLAKDRVREQRGNATDVYHYSLRAGQDAMRRKEYTTAERHFSAALKAIAGDPALNHLRPEAQKRFDEAAARGT